jgi:hypothetical protein
VEDSPACARCGAPAEPGQEYCLECGSRIAAAPRRVLHWAWPSLAALLVAAGGATAAVAAGTGSEPETIVALSPLRPAAGPPAGGTAPAGEGLTPWRRADGYTIVVAAIPIDRGAAAAAARVQKARSSGLERVGILVSSDYASLHPGYFLVFSGVYTTLEEVEAALPRARSRFPSAHVQRVVR